MGEVDKIPENLMVMDKKEPVLASVFSSGQNMEHSLGPCSPRGNNDCSAFTFVFLLDVMLIHTERSINVSWTLWLKWNKNIRSSDMLHLSRRNVPCMKFTISCPSRELSLQMFSDNGFILSMIFLIVCLSKTQFFLIYNYILSFSPCYFFMKFLQTSS